MFRLIDMVFVQKIAGKKGKIKVLSCFTDIIYFY